MDKNATSPLRVVVISIFALSCFSLLLFLWLSFGGPVPLKPEGYRVKASFPDAVQLAEQAEVRAAGVPIGRVVEKELDPQGNRTLATLQLDRKYAPLKTDARAILRQKTLLGETYVEVTTGSRRAADLPEGGRLDDARVAQTVEFDELLRIFDPETRKAFQLWQRSQAAASKGRGQDLNAAFGSFPGFAESGADLLSVLDNRRTAVRGLVRDTGTTFEAITRDEDQLRNLITETETVFSTTAAQRERLAETFRIFPTFLDESRRTFARLERFSRDTNPLFADLRPALEDLNPTLADVRRLSPDLRRFFEDLDPLIRAGDEGFPALGRVLDGLSPVFEKTAPFLAQLNPLLQYLEFQQPTLTDFISNGAGALALKIPTTEGSNGHALPQLGVTGDQSFPSDRRARTNRGNAYFEPGWLSGRDNNSSFIFPVWDCNNVGGPRRAGEPGDPACRVQAPIQFKGLSDKFPQVREDDYSRPSAQSARRKP
ncbi:MAG: MlaD family protein [Actinomycetota bacterium]|nr:MlaD family protein [Actinomycetota bacterium]